MRCVRCGLIINTHMLRTHSVSSRHSAVNLMNDGDLWAGGVGQRIVNDYRYWNAGRVESMSVGDVKIAGREWRAQSPSLGAVVVRFIATIHHLRQPTC